MDIFGWDNDRREDKMTLIKYMAMEKNSPWTCNKPFP